MVVIPIYETILELEYVPLLGEPCVKRMLE